MEVHHHPHTPKKIKEFFLEFLMIFLAVTLGFFAEGFREHQVEKSREKEFIESMVKEMKSDSVQIKKVFLDTVRISKLDSLSALLLNINHSPDAIRKCYFLNFKYATNYDAMVFNRNVLTQLKNSGNMRLIKRQSVVDSLNVFDNKITGLAYQLESRKQIIMGNYEDAYTIFDESYFIHNGKKIKWKVTIALHPNMRFLTNNKVQLLKYGAKVNMLSGITQNYYLMLKDVYEYQNRLIPFIEKEYKLEN